VKKEKKMKFTVDISNIKTYTCSYFLLALVGRW